MSSIARLTSLTSLSLWKRPLTNNLQLGLLSSLKSLQVLSLTGCPLLNDVSLSDYVTSFQALNQLYLNEGNYTSLTALSVLGSLTLLQINFCTNLFDLDPLQLLPALVDLSATGLNCSLLTSLQTLTRLTSLDITDPIRPRKRDLDFLFSLISLQHLKASNVFVKPKWLVHLPISTTRLDLSHCRHFSHRAVPFLTHLTNLEELTVSSRPGIKPVQLRAALTSHQMIVRVTGADH